MPTGLSSNGPFLIDGFFIEAIDQLFTGLGDEIVGDKNHRRRKSSTARTCQREKPLPAPIERIPAMLIPLSSLFSLLTVFLHVDILVALKCKCTQSSPKVPCEDGVCEVPTASSSYHPKSGLHYACSTNANLSEGECVEKKSKSGANVKVCSCFSSDFCNFKIWPGGRERIEEDDDEESESDEDSSEDGVERRANGAESPPLGRIKIAAIGFCLLTLLPLARIHIP